MNWQGKHVVVTTDCCYSSKQLCSILDKFGYTGFENVFVSCEYEVSKTQTLFNKVISKYPGENILHIGDDDVADIRAAEKVGLNFFKIYSGRELFEALGEFGASEYILSLSDRIKCGLFISRIFSNPFQFDDPYKKLVVKYPESIGYLVCAPVITDYILWLDDRIQRQGFKQILFCARDGYLVDKLYKKVDDKIRSIYFLTSRTAAIRAGIENEEDVSYLSSMRYSGKPEEEIRARFGIEYSEASNLKEMIFAQAERLKNNYLTYIEKLKLDSEKIALYDFVAKGTTQLYMQRFFRQHLKGFYFLQLEPEFMSDKGLDIESFYTEDEKTSSAAFEYYYILEMILTSPKPQLEEFDAEGEPQYAKETRSEQDMKCLKGLQDGILAYFTDFVQLLPDESRVINKSLDEVFLSLINKVQIMDECFLSLNVEDPFFGRTTKIKDLLGL